MADSASINCFVAYWLSKDGDIGFTDLPVTESAAVAIAVLKLDSGCAEAGVHKIRLADYADDVRRSLLCAANSRHSQVSVGNLTYRVERPERVHHFSATPTGLVAD